MRAENIQSKGKLLEIIGEFNKIIGFKVSICKSCFSLYQQKLENIQKTSPLK